MRPNKQGSSTISLMNKAQIETSKAQGAQLVSLLTKESDQTLLGATPPMMTRSKGEPPKEQPKCQVKLVRVENTRDSPWKSPLLTHTHESPSIYITKTRSIIMPLHYSG